MTSLRSISFFLPLFLAVSGYSQTFTIRDSFDSNGSGWWEGESKGGSQHVRDGKLYTDFPDGGWVISITPYVAFEKDFNQEATFREISGVENNGIGLAWGYNKKALKENYFMVSATGYYYISNTADEKGNKIDGVREW